MSRLATLVRPSPPTMADHRSEPAAVRKARYSRRHGTTTRTARKTCRQPSGFLTPQKRTS